MLASRNLGRPLVADNAVQVRISFYRVAVSQQSIVSIQRALAASLKKIAQTQAAVQRTDSLLLSIQGKLIR